MKKEEIRLILNQYGASQKAFFFAISYDFSKFYINTLDTLPKEIKYSMNNTSSIESLNKEDIIKYPISFEEYKERFDILQEYIKNGDTYLANLTFQTKIKTKFNLNDIYEKAQAKHKLKFFDKFVCFSPETFCEIKENKIYTFPIKGTIDASVANAENILLDNIKEKAEHTMVVDLLRNDLSIIASNVSVEHFRYTDIINAGDKKLLHTCSKISGNLTKNWNEKIGDILTSILPAGSVTGCPKKSTINILKELENYNRDFYTGIFGVYENDSLNSAVMIRFIEENKNKEVVFKSGGGITCDSDSFIEYQELLDKIYLAF